MFNLNGANSRLVAALADVGGAPNLRLGAAHRQEWGDAFGSSRSCDASRLPHPELGACQNWIGATLGTLPLEFRSVPHGPRHPSAAFKSKVEMLG